MSTSEGQSYGPLLVSVLVTDGLATGLSMASVTPPAAVGLTHELSSVGGPDPGVHGPATLLLDRLV